MDFRWRSDLALPKKGIIYYNQLLKLCEDPCWMYLQSSMGSTMFVHGRCRWSVVTEVCKVCQFLKLWQQADLETMSCAMYNVVLPQKTAKHWTVVSIVWKTSVGVCGWVIFLTAWSQCLSHLACPMLFCSCLGAFQNWRITPNFDDLLRLC